MAFKMFNTQRAFHINACKQWCRIAVRLKYDVNIASALESALYHWQMAEAS